MLNSTKFTPLHLREQSRGFFITLIAFFFISIPVLHVHGQNDGLVFGPEVNDKEANIDLRTAYNADEETWTYRNHIQYSFSDSFNLRGMTQHRINSSGQWDFRYFRVEGLWQFLEDETAGWDSALRFELEVAEGDNLPSRVRLAWTGSYDIDDYWQVRGNFLTGYRIGPESPPGALVEVRSQVSRRLNKNLRLAVDYFGNMNDTEAFGSWESQKHQLGPTLNIRCNEHISIVAGLLFGISRDASNKEFRLVTGYFF